MAESPQPPLGHPAGAETAVPQSPQPLQPLEQIWVEQGVAQVLHPESQPMEQQESPQQLEPQHPESQQFEPQQRVRHTVVRGRRRRREQQVLQLSHPVVQHVLQLAGAHPQHDDMTGAAQVGAQVGMTQLGSQVVAQVGAQQLVTDTVGQQFVLQVLTR